jgi:hypothetical protein
MPKPEFEFFDHSHIEWTPCAGNAKGLYEKILARDDEFHSAGTRLLRFDPGCDTSPNGVQIHDFWEELLVLEGALTDLTLNQTFTKGMYACRPPGMKHGPWVTPEGCLTFEVRYYAAGQNPKRSAPATEK